MKAEEYLTECIQKRLVPFIRKYHNIKDVLFWPDLATIHYQRGVQEWLRTNGIECVKKVDNPLNLPRCQPIELFWHLCGQEYSQRTTPPKGLKGFSNVWTHISKTGRNAMDQL